MQKAIKMINVLVVVVMILFTLSSDVMASSTEINQLLTNMDTNKNQTIQNDDGEIAKLGGQIASILTTIGIVVAVIVLLVLGIKYMIGSAQEKAEYKKTMIPYIIGAVLLLSASGIVRLLFSALKIVG